MGRVSRIEHSAAVSGVTGMPEGATPGLDGVLEIAPIFTAPREVAVYVPDWYWRHEGGVTIKTPFATVVCYGTEPYTRENLEGHRVTRAYLEPPDRTKSHYELINPELDPDLLYLHAHGVREATYRVVASDSVAEEFPDRCIDQKNPHDETCHR